MKTACITELGYWVILFIGSTLRWKVEGWRNLEEIHNNGKRFIGVFWHNRIFMTSYFFRNRNIVAMISQNRDGEYISRVSRRLGFGAARGSSSRGGRGAVVEILRALKAHRDVFFTLDGPRGPRYIAKPGAAFVAGKSGCPILPFTISVEKKWVMHSWDGFIVPKPFSHAMVLFGTAIDVDANADTTEMERVREEIQHSMNSLCHQADSCWVKNQK
ncbi:MAG: lysophospholipid acyltransferase family protein [Acidobacteria bacterium]|nr:lysophospholipid acyltransferase family protein [Acidobacteriota bacterium]